MHLLELKQITKSFMGIQVLFGVDFELKAGEIHCLVGENGAGKSTVVKILTGVYPDYGGDVSIEGRGVHITTPKISREAGIHAVQQHRDLVPTLNAVENIFLGAAHLKKFRKIDMSGLKKKAEMLIDKFNIKIDLDVPVRELKVSEQEIVAICKALSSEGKILLIDEASAPLDDAERQVLYSTLKQLRDEGHGIVYISHHLEEIFRLGDRVTVLRNGKRVWTKPVSETNREDLIDAMTGSKKIYENVSCGTEEVEDTSKDGEPILEFENVASRHLNDINFRIYKGEIIGFAGLVGANRSKVAEVAFGLDRIDSGYIRYKGKAIKVKHPIDSIRLGMGLVPTDRKQAGLITCRSVAENIMLTKVNKNRMKLITSNWIKKAARNYVKKVNIKTAGITQQVEYLSGGNQQKVLLSKWLEAEVELLFLIEPTEGIDVGARAEIYQILRELAREGKTLVIITSDIDELLALCDRVFTMVSGRILNEYRACNVDKRTILSDILSKHEAV